MSQRRPAQEREVAAPLGTHSVGSRGDGAGTRGDERRACGVYADAGSRSARGQQIDVQPSCAPLGRNGRDAVGHEADPVDELERLLAERRRRGGRGRSRASSGRHPAVSAAPASRIRAERSSGKSLAKIARDLTRRRRADRPTAGHAGGRRSSLRFSLGRMAASCLGIGGERAARPERSVGSATAAT